MRSFFFHIVIIYYQTYNVINIKWATAGQASMFRASANISPFPVDDRLY